MGHHRATSNDLTSLQEWDVMLAAEKKVRRLTDSCQRYHLLSVSKSGDWKLYETLCRQQGAHEIPAAKAAYDGALRALITALDRVKDKLAGGLEQRFLGALKKSRALDQSVGDLRALVARVGEDVRAESGGLVTSTEAFREYLIARLRRCFLDDLIVEVMVFSEIEKDQARQQELSENLRELIEKKQPAAVREETAAAARLRRDVEAALLGRFELAISAALLAGATAEGGAHAS